MIKHGVTHVDSAKVLQMKYKEYKDLLDAPENTTNEIYLKYSRLACECSEDFKFWNILKLFILKYENKLDIVKDEKYNKYVKILKEDNDKQFKQKYVDTQDNLTYLGIQNNCKSYSVWNHRKYIYKYINVTNDYKLCNLLFKLDPRNFHCWNYTKLFGYKIPTDLNNYSSLDTSLGDLSKMIMTDIDNRGFWDLLQMKLFEQREFYLKQMLNGMKIVFNKVFAGELEIDGYKINVENVTKHIYIKNIKISLESVIKIDNITYTMHKMTIPNVVKQILKIEPENENAKQFLTCFNENIYFPNK